jgi:hypothetical protein
MSFYSIYKIRCDNDEKCDKIYIGSTEEFEIRKRNHKTRCNNSNDDGYNMMLYQCIRLYGGWDNWNMTVIEKCDETISTKRLAEEREQEWIDKLNAGLNSQRAYRSDEYKTEYNKANCKKWAAENAEHIKEQRKDYRENNKDKVKEQKAADYEKHKDTRQATHKLYREANHEEIKQHKRDAYAQTKDTHAEKSKIYRETHAEEIKEMRKEKIECGCGMNFGRNDKARHYRSNKHQKWVEDKQEVKQEVKQEEQTDKSDDDKTYYQKNKEDIKEKRNKAYWEDPKKDHEKCKKYRENNPDKVAEANKKKNEKWHEEKDEINTKKREIIQCGCGSKHTVGITARHSRTKKHTDWVSKNTA